MPFFSVIVPVYNVEKYLSECVESIMKQSFEDFELILVNDGSKDASGEICDAYAKQDFRVQVIHKLNGGVVSARKAGLQKSAGSYVVNIDSDDYLSEDYLGNHYEIIQKTNADIVSSSLLFVTECGDVIHTKKQNLPEGVYSEKQIEGLCCKLLYDFEMPFHNVGCLPWNLCGKTFRKELAEKMQLAVPDTIRNGEDCAVMIPAICNANKLYVSNYCGYHYRQIETSMVHAFNPREAESLEVLLQHLSEYNLPIPEENIIAFAVRMLWVQMIKVARGVNSAAEMKPMMQQNYRNVISFITQGMKKKKMTVGIYLRMLPIRMQWWHLLWWGYHR